jgi:NAD kinase
MNVGSNYSQEYVSQEYATHGVDDEFEVDVDAEGLVGAPKEGSTNYTVEDHGASLQGGH